MVLNEAHHVKRSAGGVGGTVKRTLFNHIKSGNANSSSPQEFAAQAALVIPSIITITYHQTKEIIEPASVENTPAIKGALSMHTTSNGVCL